MIENIKIEINNEDKVKKIKKSNLIVRLSILCVFLFTILISAIVIFTGNKKQTVGIGSSGGVRDINSISHTYQRIHFTNLKDHGSAKTIYADDFKAKVDGKEYVGKYIIKENLDNVLNLEDSLLTEYELIFDGKDKSFYVCFEMGNSQDIKYYYNGELLDYVSLTGASYIFLSVLAAETLIFGIAFIIISSRLSARFYTKNGEKYRIINEKVIQKLKDIKFNITKTFSLSGRKSGVEEIEKLLIFADSKNKKLALVDYDKLVCKVVDYKDIISYKIDERNGTDVGSKLHYSIILDSAYTTTSSRDVCKRLQLVFILNDEDDTTIIYELVRSRIGMDSNNYKKLSKEMIDITSFLDVIEKNTPKDKKFVYCKHCGTKNDYDEKKCSSCGAVIE